MDNPLKVLQKLGQSVWLDNLSRDLLRSGELARLICEDGISGITTNPAIFEKAITEDRSYDNDIHRLVDQGLGVHEIYEELVISDVRDAADLLRETYEQSARQDGYVSVEVAPDLAYDPTGTVEQAVRLFQRIGRPNVMVKVPATRPGMQAVRDLMKAGINVNVTLIFDREQTMEAASAYIDGTDAWNLAGGGPHGPVCVASLFVSRVDTVIDDLLKDLSEHHVKLQAKDLMGKAAIANAKLAYAGHRAVFQSERFKEASKIGVVPQRIVWASTSTKNPAYGDTYYVESLVGPYSVNTMPPHTLNAFRDHGKVVSAIEVDLEGARQHMEKLEYLGLDMVGIMDRLLADGLKSFSDAFQRLLHEIGTKRTRLLRGWGHRSASLGKLQDKVDRTLKTLDTERLSENLWNGETSLWTDDPESAKEINRRLGWLHIVDILSGETDKLRAFAEEIRSEGFSDAIILGMGGSSLAAEVYSQCFGDQEGYPKLTVLDTTVPDTVLRVENTLDLKRTLFVVASKSGGTIEVVSLYKYFRRKLEALLGSRAGRNFVAITDPGTDLGRLAGEHGFRRVFLNPPDIGGRFSALSYFGMVPAALIGAKLDLLLMRAAQATEASGPGVRTLESPGAWLGTILAESALAGADKLTLIISPKVASFGCWLEQLVAESTGKMGRGIIPVDGEPIGDERAYGNDRIFVYLRLDEDAGYDEAVSRLEKAGHAVVTLRLHGPYDVGREMFRWEYATAVAGALLHVNPFDQPNVQESKDITKKMLTEFVSQGKLPEIDYVSPDSPDLSGIVRGLVESAEPGSYIGINAFIDPTEKNKAVLQEFRRYLSSNYRLATCLGFGPRYLHSTGQIHKGGPRKGLFMLITCEDKAELEIPGEKYSLNVLKTAQALGDCMALKNKGIPVMRIHMRSDEELEKLKGLCGTHP